MKLLNTITSKIQYFRTAPIKPNLNNLYVGNAVGQKPYRFVFWIQVESVPLTKSKSIMRRNMILNPSSNFFNYL